MPTTGAAAGNIIATIITSQPVTNAVAPIDMSPQPMRAVRAQATAATTSTGRTIVRIAERPPLATSIAKGPVSGPSPIRVAAASPAIAPPGFPVPLRSSRHPHDLARETGDVLHRVDHRSP